jgi:hypothetical protein
MLLGIDTGGTYTDAVVYDEVAGVVLAKAKSPTTHHDLAIGICAAIVLNAGGQGSPVCAVISVSTAMCSRCAGWRGNDPATSSPVHDPHGSATLFDGDRLAGDRGGRPASRLSPSPLSSAFEIRSTSCRRGHPHPHR